MLLRLAALITLAVSVFFLHRAADPIFEQNRRVRQWPGVDVAVEVTPRPATTRAVGDAGAGGGWLVRYRHQVGGNVYRNTPLEPRAGDVPNADAELIAAGAGAYTRRGHYDPARPDKVFLPKAFGVRDYLPIFVFAPLLALGLSGLPMRKPRRPPADRGGRGWHRLHPTVPLRQRAGGAWVVAVVCNLLLAITAYDYFTSEPRARSTLSDLLVCLGMAPAVVASAVAIHFSRAARRGGEPRVSVDALRPRTSERLAVKVELPPRPDLDLDRVRVGLVCVRAGGPGTREQPVHEDHADRALADRALAGRGRPGEPVTFEQRFRIPSGAEPSSLSRAGLRGPWVEWFVEVSYAVHDGPAYRGRFPVTVDAAPKAE